VTPEQEAFRDMWLAEMWKPVPEWHQAKDERLDAEARNAYAHRNAQPGDDTPDGPESRVA
jgi:hypothetical protein